MPSHVSRPFGVVTRYRQHIPRFDLAFWTTKDVGGAVSPCPDGAIPMVSCFGDNRLARARPDWVQIGPDGERGDRSSRYFDWSTLCPTRTDVFDTALGWVRDAARKSDLGLRLDDVTYAREGFCRCPVCTEAAAERGFDALRIERILAFTAACRPLVRGPLSFTLFPDPYPGHLERRFGVSPERLAPLVDFFVVPIYDLAYTTTYWVEVLAQGFRDRLQKPFYVELYGLDVPERQLQRAARVADAYADGVLIAYDRDLEKIVRVKDAVRSEEG